MEDETETCFDCDFSYYSRKDDKWYCERPQEGYPIREVDPNSSACSRFYEVEEDKTCGDCEYAYFGLESKDYCEWHGEIDLDDSACSWFHALPDIEEERYLNIEHCSTCQFYKYCWSLYHAICNGEGIKNEHVR